LKQNRAVIAFVLLAALLLASAGGYGQEYKHYLHFFQIRFDDDIGPPQPEGLVEFTVGPYVYEGADQYIYASYKTVDGHREINRSEADRYAVALTDYEINEVFGDGETIKKSELQRADIRKLYWQMFPRKDLNYGVRTNRDGTEEVDKEGCSKPDSPLESYQQGKTIVMPTTYSSLYPTRYFLNTNNEAVREYQVRYALKILGQGKDNVLYIDNIGFNWEQYCDVCTKKPDERCPADVYTKYVSNGTVKEQATVYGKHLMEVLGRIKNSATSPKVIINGLRDNDPIKNLFFNALREDGNSQVVDGVLIENRFWQDDAGPEEYETWCTDIEFYLGWLSWAKEKNKMMLFAAGDSDAFQNDDFVEDIWLWLHLVGNENTYIYINDSYTKQMIKYDVYDFPLGMPEADQPTKNGNVWTREYERGTITFDTSSGRLNAIKFEERKPPQEICDGIDNDGDGLVDEDNVCCGNNVIDSGENCSNCPADVQCQAGQQCCAGICCQAGQQCCSGNCTTPACSTDSQCPAGQTCRNPGQCSAECINADDGETCTTSTDCPATQVCCNGSCVMPACSTDSQCNDNNKCTLDQCNNAGTCSAECTHTAIPDCGAGPKPPKQVIVQYQQTVETGKKQNITVKTEDGSPVEEFSVILEFPNKTKITLMAINGEVTLPIGQAGIYRGLVKTAGYETNISFEAKKPMQIIPNIPDEKKPWFEAVFGILVTENPNYLIIWLMAIAIISGLIMVITKLKPAWFRAFMSFSYTLLPFAVNHYTKNTWIAFATIAIQTTILIAIWFRQLKIQRIEEEEAKKQKEKLHKKWKGQIEQGNLPWLKKTETESEWDEYIKGRGF